MGRSSLRHNREIQGIDSAGETPEKYGETYNNRQDANGNPVDNPNGPTAIEFYGPVTDRQGSVGNAFGMNMAQYFSGGDDPTTYALTTGTLPAGLSLNTDTGGITGEPTTEEVASGLIVTASDLSGDTASTNAFTITVVAA